MIYHGQARKKRRQCFSSRRQVNVQRKRDVIEKRKSMEKHSKSIGKSCPRTRSSISCGITAHRIKLPTSHDLSAASLAQSLDRCSQDSTKDATISTSSDSLGTVEVRDLQLPSCLEINLSEHSKRKPSTLKSASGRRRRPRTMTSLHLLTPVLFSNKFAGFTSRWTTSRGAPRDQVAAACKKATAGKHHASDPFVVQIVDASDELKAQVLHLRGGGTQASCTTLAQFKRSLIASKQDIACLRLSQRALAVMKSVTLLQTTSVRVGGSR